MLMVGVVAAADAVAVADDVLAHDGEPTAGFGLPARVAPVVPWVRPRVAVARDGLQPVRVW